MLGNGRTYPTIETVEFGKSSSVELIMLKKIHST